MIEFAAGIVLGAAFSPLWMKLYDIAVARVKAFLDAE
jgi:hypothetical protein